MNVHDTNGGMRIYDTQGYAPGVSGISAGTTQATGPYVLFSNANGVSFGVDGKTVTASVNAGGSPVISAGTSSNNLGSIVFSDSNGVSFGLNGSTLTATVATNYLTTAMASNRGSDFVQANATIAGTSISGTVASNGLSLSVGPYLTTAMASNRGSDFVQANATIAGTSISGTIASNGMSLSVGPYLTTAMASNAGSNFVQAGAGFNGTNCSGTIASNAISVSVGNYLTTAMASNRGSDFVQANATIAGTSISGTIASNGMSLSVGPYLTTAMASNAATISNIRLSAGTSSANLSAVTFSNSNNLSFGLNGSVITASNAGPTLSYWDNLCIGATGNSELSDAALVIFPMTNVFPGTMAPATLFLNVIGTMSTGAPFTRSLSIGFYTISNSTQAALAFSASTSWGTNAANMAMSGSFAGYKWLTFHSSLFNNAPTFSATKYLMAVWHRSSSGSQTFSLHGMSGGYHTALRSGFMSSVSTVVLDTTQGFQPFVGNYSVSFTTAMPSAINVTDINKTGGTAGGGFVPHLVMQNIGSDIG